MEIILLIQEENQSGWSCFPSTSTYIQSKSSWCPSFKSQVWELECHTYGPSHTSLLTERWFGLKAPWASYQCHGHLWDCTFQKEGNCTPWGTQFSLSWWISDNMWSTSGSSPSSVTASHEYTGQNLFCREKMSFQTPKLKTLDSEIKERLSKNTVWAAISIGRVFSP